MLDEMTTTNSGSSFLKGRNLLWIGLAGAGFIGFHLYFQSLQKNSAAWLSWFHQHLSAQLMLEIAALILATLSATAARRSSKSQQLAWPMAMLVGALVTAPVNSLHGMILGALGGWLARGRSMVKDPGAMQAGVPARARPWWQLCRPTNLESAGMLAFACLLGFGLSGQFASWTYYVVATGFAKTGVDVRLELAAWSTALVVLMAVLLAWGFGRAMVSVGAVGITVGLFASMAVYWFPPAQQRLASILLLVASVLGQFALVCIAVARPSISRRSPYELARRLVGSLILCVAFWPFFWIGLQLDTIRRMTYLSAGLRDIYLAPAEFPQSLLGLAHVEAVSIPDEVSSRDIALLRGLPFLSSIDLSHWRQTGQRKNRASLTLAQFHALGQLPSLQTIQIDGLTDEKLAALMKAPLIRLGVLGGRLSPAAMKSLQSDTLTELVLYDMGLTDAHMAQLPPLPALTALSLQTNQLRGHSLDRLVSFPRLLSLDLSANPIEEDTLAQLQQLPALKHLSLNGVPLRNAQRSQLGKLRLTTLTVFRTGINDSWAAEFLRQFMEQPAESRSRLSFQIEENSLSAESLRQLDKVMDGRVAAPPRYGRVDAIAPGSE